MRTMQELKTERDRLRAEADKIITAADAEKRDLTAEELEAIKDFRAQSDDVAAQIEAREHIETIRANTEATTTGRTTEPSAPRAPDVRVQDGVTRQRPSGFAHIGEFAAHVLRANSGQGVSQRLIDWNRSPQVQAAATTFANEGSGSDGGYLVPQEFYSQIMSVPDGEVDIMGMCFALPLTVSNAIDVPVDDALDFSSTTKGIQAKKTKENEAITQSKPAFDKVSLKLNTTRVLVPATDEIIQDARLLEAYITKSAGKKIRTRINNEIINGNGTGEALGVMNAACLVSVAKEGSQTTDTVVAANVIKMFARPHAPFRGNAVWLYDQDVEAQLLAATIGTTGWPLLLPGNSMIGKPANTIFGRPAFATDLCAKLGDKGDIVFADFSQYLLAQRSSGIEAASSIHLFFDSGATAFRFTTRTDGKPWLPSAITPRNGGSTKSAFVTLDERA